MHLEIGVFIKMRKRERERERVRNVKIRNSELHGDNVRRGIERSLGIHARFIKH